MTVTVIHHLSHSEKYLGIKSILYTAGDLELVADDDEKVLVCPISYLDGLIVK